MQNLPVLAAGGQVVFPDEFQLGAWEGMPLTWRVLSLEDGRVMALAKRAVAVRAYADAPGATSWADSALRAWLSGEFAEGAFDADEAACLVERELANEGNPEFGTAGSDGTRDLVFALSYDEVTELLPVEARRALEGENGMWWLRTPGGADGFAAYVHNNGWINGYGYNVDLPQVCVRPAVVLDVAALVPDADPAAVVRAAEYGEELMLEAMEAESVDELQVLAPFVDTFGVDESWESFAVEKLEECAAAGDAGAIEELFDLFGSIEFLSGALCAALGEGHTAAASALIRRGARLDGRCAEVALVNDTPELHKVRKAAYGADRSWYATALEGEATAHTVRVLVSQGVLAKADWRGLLYAAASREECQDLFAWMLCPDHQPLDGVRVRWVGKRVTVVPGSSKKDVLVSAEGLRMLWHPSLCKEDPESVRVMAPHLGFRDLDEKGALLDLLAAKGWNRELRSLLDVYRMFSLNQLKAGVVTAKKAGNKTTAGMLLDLMRSIGAGKAAAELE